MKIDLIVTRHPGLVGYLRELGIVAEGVEVRTHATADDVRGRNVCGVLPHSLSCLTASFTEVPLDLPPELRGKELTLEAMRQYAGDPVTYKVARIVQEYTCALCGGFFPQTACPVCGAEGYAV